MNVLFVTLDQMYVEGLVHITELGGEYFKFDEAIPQPKPYQQPHPPVWFVSIGPGPGNWIAEQNGKVGTFLTGRDSKLLFDTYRRKWLSLGWGMPPLDKLGYMGIVAAIKRVLAARKK